jgi:hypothetical protein
VFHTTPQHSDQFCLQFVKRNIKKIHVSGEQSATDAWGWQPYRPLRPVTGIALLFLLLSLQPSVWLFSSLPTIKLGNGNQKFQT